MRVDLLRGRVLVGGIGIMNIIWPTCWNAPKISASGGRLVRRADMRLQFLIEAITISMLGELMDITLGFAIAKLGVYFAGWSAIITTRSRGSVDI